MLSGISRVSRVRVSAWLGSTLDSGGCSSTSSKVRPERDVVVEVMVRPYRAHASESQRFAKPVSARALRARQQPLVPPRRASPRSSRPRTARRRRSPRRSAAGRASISVLARARTGGWQVSIWLGWISDLPSKPEARPSAAFGGKPVVGLEPVVDAVEGGDAGGARGEHDPLQRICSGRAARARPASRGRRRDRWCRRSGRARRGAIAGARRARRAAVSIIASTGLPISQRHRAPACASRPWRGRRNRPAAWRDRDDVLAMPCGLPTPLTRIATGHRPKPSASPRPPPRAPPPCPPASPHPRGRG